MTLVDAFNQIYSKFKLNFYKNAFLSFEDKEASLSTSEAFCMEVINSMNKPTVNEFSKFIEVSSPNAAYKINSLVKKGYLQRVQSKKDKREFHLEVTNKYLKHCKKNAGYVNGVMERVEKRLSKEEIEQFKKILEIMSEEII